MKLVDIVQSHSNIRQGSQIRAECLIHCPVSIPRREGEPLFRQQGLAWQFGPQVVSQDLISRLEGAYLQQSDVW